MIDYKRHRGFLIKTESGNWTSSAKGDLLQDAAEILDKAEERDKYRKALESLRHIYSTAFSPDEVIGSAQLACEVVRKALGDSQSYL